MPLMARNDVAVQRTLSSDEDGNVLGTETVILSEGEILGEDEVPKYVLEAVKKGEAGGLVKVTDAEAKKASEALAERHEAEQVVNASNAEADANKA